MSAAVAERTVGYQHPAVPWNGLTVTDLFCGAGGSSSGLVEAGYRVVIAANHVRYCRECRNEHSRKYRARVRGEQR